MQIDQATQERLAALEGLVSHELGMTLAGHASLVPASKAIVEVGSYKGKSTCYLATGARYGLGAPVYAVDPWNTVGNITGRFGFAAPETYAAFQAQVASMGFTKDEVTPKRAFSTVAAKTWPRHHRIGLLYIDGSHTAKDVLADWRAWSPFVDVGGVIAFDDYDTPKNPGVKVVVDSLRAMPGYVWTFGPHPLVAARRVA